MAYTSTTQTISDFKNANIIQQYAKEVVNFSSQYGSENSISYAATNLAGKETVFPKYGDFTAACVLRTYGPWWMFAPSYPQQYFHTPATFCSQDFIDLQFEQVVYPQTIEIFEVYHPGAVVRILACDSYSGSDKSSWLTLWSGAPQCLPAKPNKFAPPLKDCPFSTDLIRLEFNSTLLDYYAELDAVRLHGVVDTAHLPSSGPASGPASGHASPTHTQSDRGGSPTGRAHGGGDLASNQCSSSATNLTESCETRVSTQLAELHLIDGLTAALDGPNNGYFDTLPEEVIQLIISYLEVPALCCLASTCHLLHKHCYDPLQYTDLNLQPYWTRVNDKSLAGLRSRCGHLQRLNLSWCGDQETISADSFSSFLQFSGSELTTLSLACCRFLDGICLKSISQYCPLLQELDIQSCREVDHVDLFHVKRLTKLTRLNLYRSKIDVQCLVSIIKACPDLVHLNLGSCHNVNDFDAVAVELANHCRNLRSVDLWRARSLSDRGLHSLASQCKLLEELDLGWCSDLRSPTGCFEHLAKNCKFLKKLFLTANRSVCDNDLHAISTHCPNLEQLDLLGTKEITLEGTLKILESCRGLRFLDVSFCAGIDFSTVHEWKKRYPHVAIKKSYQNV